MKTNTNELVSNLQDVAKALMQKADRRCRIGWIDWSSGSFDWQLANAKAWRIFARIKHGKRLSLSDALRGNWYPGN